MNLPPINIAAIEIITALSLSLSLSVGILMDRLFGEAPRWHPLVGFGRLARIIEGCLHAQTARPWQMRLRGLLALLLITLPLLGLCWLSVAALNTYAPITAPLFSIVILYLALGGRSLVLHARAIYEALAADDLDLARQRVGFIVSRETQHLQRDDLCRASVESVLENGSDAVFGALFWFAIAGAPGVLAYRLCNTLDAMWGYKNTRYLHFGWAAARCDDAINYIPARLCALSYALVGIFSGRCMAALNCWRKQAPHWDSPNAGPVMAAGAGALGVQLGGAATYHGQLEQRSELGHGAAPTAHDIVRALALVRSSVVLWIICVSAGTIFYQVAYA